MSDELHQKILAFLAGEIARKETRTCKSIELSHAPMGSRGEILGTWDREEQPEFFDGQNNTEALTSRMVQLAEQEADAWPGPQRFVIRTKRYLGDGAKMTFQIAPEYQGEESTTAAMAVAGAAGGNAEIGVIAVLQNTIAMLQRHNERHAGINAQMFKGTIDVLGNANTELVTENQKLREERSTMMRELETARSSQDERDLKGMAQISSDKRKDQAVGKLLTLAPVVAASIMGKGGQGAGGALALLVAELGKSLSGEQIQRIAGSLKPEQQILFAKAMETAKNSLPPEEKEKPESEPSDEKAG